METAGNRNQKSRNREGKVRDLVSVMAQMASIGTAMKKYGVLMLLTTDRTGTFISCERTSGFIKVNFRLLKRTFEHWEQNMPVCSLNLTV